MLKYNYVIFLNIPVKTESNLTTNVCNHFFPVYFINGLYWNSVNWTKIAEKAPADNPPTSSSI